MGKTTTIAKLAANFRLRERRRIGLITVDTYRIAADRAPYEFRTEARSHEIGDSSPGRRTHAAEGLRRDKPHVSPAILECVDQRGNGFISGGFHII